DPVIETRLSEYPAVNLSATNLLDQYPQPNVAAKKLNISVGEYQKRIQDAAKQIPGTSSLAYRDQNEIVNNLMQVKVLRAVYSERQLSEQLSDLWFNHFNALVDNVLHRCFMIPCERDCIGNHVLGKFRDL